jgi:dihydroxyacetone kinase-like predicted kinase
VAHRAGCPVGIVGKEIVITHEKVLNTAVALADALLTTGEDRFMLTAFVGKDTTEDEAAAVEEMIRSMHPDAEIYFTSGGQDIYPYIFVAE